MKLTVLVLALMLIFSLVAYSTEITNATTTGPVTVADGKEVVTNPEVINLFEKGSPFAVVIYVVFVILLFVVILFGGITVYSMGNAAKASRNLVEALSDIRVFAENFSAYKEKLDNELESLHETIKAIDTRNARDFKAIFDRLNAINNEISDLDKTITQMYSYCAGKNQTPIKIKGEG